MCTGKSKSTMGAGMLIGGADPLMGTAFGGKGIMDNTKEQKKKSKEAERKYRDSLLDHPATSQQETANQRWLAANKAQPFSGGGLLGGNASTNNNSKLGGS